MSNAVSFSSLKESALYFDRVVPINPIEFIRWDEPHFSESYGDDQFFDDRDKQLLSALRRNEGIIGNLLFGAEHKKQAVGSAIEALYLYTKAAQMPSRERMPQAYFNAHYVQHSMLRVQQHMLANSYVDDERVEEIGVSVRKIISDTCETFSINQASIVLPAEFQDKESSAMDTESSLIATVSKLGLIDTSKASWEQILEIRSDQTCHSSLRRFRLSIFDSYQEKDESYIRDDIFLKMEEYDRAVKKHGLDKSDSLISAIISSDSVNASLLAAASGGFAAANGFAPLAAGLFTFSTLPIIREIATVTIERRKANREMANYHRTHPLSYIFDARKLLR